MQTQPIERRHAGHDQDLSAQELAQYGIDFMDQLAQGGSITRGNF